MKSPAFQFYPQDFILGTLDLNLDAIGLYIKILSYMWVKGDEEDCSLEFNEKKIAKLCGITPSKFKQKFSTIEQKFTFFERKNDEKCSIFFRNEKLKKIKNEQNTFREKQSENAKNRWNKAKKETLPSVSESMPSHSDGNAKLMPSECPSPSSSKKINKLGKNFLKNLKQKIGIENFNDSRQYQEDYASHFMDLLEEIGEKEFEHRLKKILEKPSKATQCNKINFVYREIKNYVPDPSEKISNQKKVEKLQQKQQQEEQSEAEKAEESKRQAVEQWQKDNPQEYKKIYEECLEQVPDRGSIVARLSEAKVMARVKIAEHLNL